MSKLIRELRRREVFRATGLYVGIAWLFIEAASIFLPAFDAPDWVLRALIIIAVIGLPVTVVLAWIFDITETGIEVQADPTDTVIIPFGSRRMDFIVIGVLTIALTFSIYMNIADNRSDVIETIEPISILIADFENRTGDALFDGTLEQALQIGVESASFITGYRRDAALRLAATMERGDGKLDIETSRLVSVREGIKLVVAGTIEEDDGEYTLYVRALDPRGGEVLTSAKVDARDKLDVLAAVGTLSGDLREALGDDSLDRDRLVTSETFTAKNLEAAQAYSKAQSLQYGGNYAEAMTYYEAALQHDPNFGRAYSGLALSANALGRTDEATVLWEKALATLNTMTERERLRTLGLYYSVVTRNFSKAIETYEQLVEKYPADDTAHNGLAVQYFYSLNFDNALRQGRVLLDIYPNSVMGRSNYALYAMYASDFETAATEANTARELDPGYFKAWLPVAIKAISDGELDKAREAYRAMADSSDRGKLTAALGIADVGLFGGDHEAARESLEGGISAAEEAGSQYYVATMKMALAESFMLQGNSDATLETLREAVAISSGLSRQVPAAIMLTQLGEADKAQAIADNLGSTLQAQNRAYAALINGLILLHDGEIVSAVDSISAGIVLADLWLLRFYLGQAYLEAGHHAEALDEFTACENRRGEASSVFLDDLPTYRYMAELPYWTGRAQLALGMRDAGQENLAAFLARRPHGGPLADNARQLLQ